jgi:hypothetical protein
VASWVIAACSVVVVTNASEDRTASIFRFEDEGGKLLRNFGTQKTMNYRRQKVGNLAADAFSHKRFFRIKRSTTCVCKECPTNKDVPIYYIDTAN